MSVAYHAAVDPHRMAIVSPAGRRSFGELGGRRFDRWSFAVDVRPLWQMAVDAEIFACVIAGVFGRKAGETITYRTPRGELQVKLLAVEQP